MLFRKTSIPVWQVLVAITATAALLFYSIPKGDPKSPQTDLQISEFEASQKGKSLWDVDQEQCKADPEKCEKENRIIQAKLQLASEATMWCTTPTDADVNGLQMGKLVLIGTNSDAMGAKVVLVWEGGKTEYQFNPLPGSLVGGECKNPWTIVSYSPSIPKISVIIKSKDAVYTFPPILLRGEVRFLSFHIDPGKKLARLSPWPTDRPPLETKAR